MEFTHINDCWERLGKARSIKELDVAFGELPRWSGDWEYEIYILDNRPQVRVHNSYYDNQCEDWEDEYQSLPDIFITKEDLENYGRHIFNEDTDTEIDADEYLVPVKSYHYEIDGADLTVYIELEDACRQSSKFIKLCTYEECLASHATHEGICDMIEDTILEEEGYCLEEE